LDRGWVGPRAVVLVLNYSEGRFTCGQYSDALNDRGSIAGMGREFFCSQPRTDQLCGPHSFLSNKYGSLFLGGKVAGA